MLAEVCAVLLDWNDGATAQLASRQCGGQPQRSEPPLHRSATPAAVLCPPAARHRRPAVVRRADGVHAVPGGPPHVQTSAAGRGRRRRTTPRHAAGPLSRRPAATSRRRHGTAARTRRLAPAAAATAATISATGLIEINHCTGRGVDFYPKQGLIPFLLSIAYIVLIPLRFPAFCKIQPGSLWRATCAVANGHDVRAWSVCWIRCYATVLTCPIGILC